MSNVAVADSGLDEIKQIFITECADGLDAIETGLLDLEKGTDTLETINDIFRGAHSIKGGAATFGYSNIADFTHVLETLLDRVRGNELVATPPLVKLFLDSVDCLREMVDSMDEGDSYDVERAEQIQTELNKWLGDEAPEPTEDNSVSTDIKSSSSVHDGEPGAVSEWKISFSPKEEFLNNGNQPQHIFRALSELGKATLETDYSRVPEFKNYDPSKLYLSWIITLEANVEIEQIKEVFDWVELESEIEITQTVIAAIPEEIAKVEQVEPERRAGDRRQSDRRGNKKESSSIRVDIEKIDVLLNLVGEMVINQAMLNQLNRNKGAQESERELEQGLALLERTTRELQEAVMEIRMLPVSVTFSRFPRLVYDLSAKLEKKVELIITGEQTELDKTVLEKIGDPLLHLIRNSLDHGIENPEERILSDKDETGVIHLSASHEGGSVVIRVTDDGAGLNTEKILSKAIEKGLVESDHKMTDEQINDLVFHPGFSTADEVTDVSGRGVGMDVVRSNIEEIGGRVEVYSERGKGSTFQINLPLTLAILDGQLVRVNKEVYVVPLLSIVETVQLKKERVNIISGREVVYRLRGNAIPVIDMRSICRVPGNETLDGFEGKQLIIVESERKSVGLVVDELLDQHQVVIKSLETNFVKIPGMLGATILGDGTVSLILDVTTIGETLIKESTRLIEH